MASAAKQSSLSSWLLDCFVASLREKLLAFPDLATTAESE
jgi:hypothetical protein